MSIFDDLEHSWKEALSSEFTKPYIQKLDTYIEHAYANTTIYPQKADMFNAFKLCPYNNTRVVILGQDPYHGEHQAHGLAFSVQSNTSLPPSLKNIYKEMHTDLGIPIRTEGDLSYLASQGVLLLNSTLTVEAGKPGSHKNQGWETFTDTVIQIISNTRDHIVFILWGQYAKEKEYLIDTTKHLILKAPHPSPFSAYTGFFGSKPFSQTNIYLKTWNKKEIDW